jgi:SNF2 family DNA or RNA helicase
VSQTLILFSCIALRRAVFISIIFLIVDSDHIQCLACRTKETLATGHFMSVINILMQLRKVCNHPSLFDPRPIVSPFKTDGINYCVPSLVLNCLNYDPFKVSVVGVMLCQ